MGGTAPDWRAASLLWAVVPQGEWGIPCSSEAESLAKGGHSAEVPSNRGSRGAAPARAVA
ncbi:hypothetical protein GCM10010245_09100 [Streptomyces spectabilis]|nr:hypothetical protein GCM10010245_09100 [Streptomyces spectabilis]